VVTLPRDTQLVGNSHTQDGMENRQKDVERKVQREIDRTLDSG